MNKFLICLLILNLSLLCGCSKSTNPADLSTVDIDELIKSPTSIQIDSTNFTLSVYLWRDFMPISPIDGKPMEAVVYIQASDYSDFPTNLNADKLWVIDSAEIWETDLVDFTVDSLFQISKKASDGPKWQTGIFVDAVVRLVQDDSIYYYLKTENIEIIRTN